MPAEQFYVGLMSGTSMDGIDAVLADLSWKQPRLISHHQHTYSADLRKQLVVLSQPGENEIDRLGEADIQVAEAFAEATLSLLRKSSVSADDIKAIGSHGQTLRHRPEFKHPFTLQIGDPSTLAQRTGITTVADFRRRDMAAGGQGAPLAPAFHKAVFQHSELDRVILNIGGIANITYLPANATTILGLDTGPGNTLLDHWVKNTSPRITTLTASGRQRVKSYPIYWLNSYPTPISRPPHRKAPAPTTLTWRGCRNGQKGQSTPQLTFRPRSLNSAPNP